MKITDVRVHRVPLDMRLEYGKGLAIEWECQLVRVIGEDGFEGHSQPISLTGGRSLADAIVHFIKPLIVGEDPLYAERIWQKVWRADRLGFMSCVAQGAIDVAIWDLAGKVANLPVYKMLGGFRDKVRAYASTATLPTPEAFASFATDLVAQGFTAIKLHAWGDPRRDVTACEKVREAVGSGIDLMLDPVGVYTRAESLAVGRELERLGFYWFEEPMSEHDLSGYEELCRSLDIPVAGGETLGGGFYSYPSLLTHHAVDILRASAALVRGITPQKKAAGMAEAFNVPCEPNAYGFPLMQAANLHLICSIPNCEFFEVPVPFGMLDVLAKQHLTMDEQGFVAVPQGPGLGIPIDMEEVERRTTEIVA